MMQRPDCVPWDKKPQAPLSGDNRRGAWVVRLRLLNPPILNRPVTRNVIGKLKMYRGYP
jgi:hypothetical protein